MDAQLAPIDAGTVCQNAQLNIGQSSEVISSSIRCSQATSLTRVIGQEKMDFVVSAQAEYGIDKVDVAFMFDVSGSMNSSSRLRNLKAAAKEAIDILLPQGASPKIIENTRLSMVSYNTMVNAGEHFEDVTGVPATRTYEHILGGSGSGSGVTTDVGDLLKDLEITLMNADTGRPISQIGDDAVIGIEDWTRAGRTQQRLSIDIKVPSNNRNARKFKSIRLDLRGREYHKQVENYAPTPSMGIAAISIMGETGVKVTIGYVCGSTNRSAVASCMIRQSDLKLESRAKVNPRSLNIR